jgi:hypothetical protein
MLPTAAGAELQTALVAAISPAQLSEIESACNSAGLQISSIALRPLQIVQMAIESGQLPSTGRTMVVCVSESTMDILILRDGKVLQVRSTKLPHETELVSGALQGEVRRSLLAASTDLENKPVDCVLLISSATRAEALLTPLRHSGSANVVSLHTDSLLSSADPKLADSAGARLAAVAGALSLKSSDRATSIDFKNPKRRPPKKSNSRSWVLAAGAAAVLLVGSISWYYSTIREMDNEYEAIQKEIAELKKKEGDSAKSRLASYTAIQRFAAGSPNWLDELSTISQKIPSAEKVMFENPTFSLNIRGGTGVIDVGVKSKDTESISKVVESLNSDGYEVRNTNTQELNKPEGLYKFLGTIKMELRNRGWDISSARSDESKPAIGTSSKPAESTATKPEEDAQTDKDEKAENPATETTDKPEEKKPSQPEALAPSSEAPKSEAPKPLVPEKAETPSPTQPEAAPPAATPPAPVQPPNAPTQLEPTQLEPTQLEPIPFAPAADPFGEPAPAPTQPDSPPDSGN